MNITRILMAAILIIGLNEITFAQQKTFKLDPTTSKKLQEMEKQENFRRRMESRTRVTRSDFGKPVVPPLSSADNKKISLKEKFAREAAKRKQYERLADSIAASRGKTGVVYIPHVIQKTRQIDKQQQAEQGSQRRNSIPNQFRLRPAPKAMYPANKK